MRNAIAHYLRPALLSDFAQENPGRSAAITGGAAAAGSLVGAIIGGVIGMSMAANAIVDASGMPVDQQRVSARFFAAPLAVGCGSIAGGAVGGALGAGDGDRGRGALGGGLGGIVGPLGAGIGGAIAGGTADTNNPA